jgi:hypothetical protein
MRTDTVITRIPLHHITSPAAVVAALPADEFAFTPAMFPAFSLPMRPLVARREDVQDHHAAGVTTEGPPRSTT